MSYYQEGQSGLGQIMPGSASLIGSGLTVNKSSSAPTSTNGMPVNLVASLRLAFSAAAKDPWGSDTATPAKLNGISVLLGAIRPNSSGLIPAATVKSLLDTGTLPENLRQYVDYYLSGVTIGSVLADINAGKYTVTAPAAPTLKLSTALTSAAALKMQVAATAVQNAQTKQAVADQAAQTAAQTKSSSDAATAQQAQAAADAAAASAQAATQDAAATAAQAAQPTDQSIGPADLVAPATTTAAHVPAGGAGGIPWMYVGIGAAGLAVVGWVLMSRKSSTPNRSRRSKKNRARRARAQRKV